VAELLGEPAAGLPPPQDYPTKPYDPDLSLDFVTQPSVGVGRDAFGTYVGGGIALGFSDMLGNHQLLAGIQANGSVDEVGGTVSYLNRSSRWNWGGSVDYIPYVRRAFSSTFGIVEGEPAVIEQRFRSRQRVFGVTGLAEYPFNRSHRVEFFAGAQNIDFGLDVQTRAFSTIDGALIVDEEEDLGGPDSLNLASGGAALVYDTSLFGATSPILGRRYRLEVQQTGGSLTYATALADGRQYFMPVRPFTIAARGMYSGRFGRDAEDQRLFPYFLGYPTLVRGYESGSFDASECSIAPTGGCPEFDRLLGSQMLVANLELRFPVWGLFRPDEFYGPLPVDFIAFGDAGVAWTDDVSPTFAGGDRDWVRSVGVGFRINFFGYAVGEVDYVKALDRDRGWTWQFTFAPGF
jgi:outer membrane protein assembly factor BamA